MLMFSPLVLECPPHINGLPRPQLAVHVDCQILGLISHSSYRWCLTSSEIIILPRLVVTPMCVLFFHSTTILKKQPSKKTNNLYVSYGFLKTAAYTCGICLKAEQKALQTDTGIL